MKGVSTSPGSEEAHRKLVAECLEELALMGFAAWENQRRAVQVRDRWVSLTKSGRGDIQVILSLDLGGNIYGIHGEVECKTGRSDQATKQRAHMRMVRGSGGVYIVARDRLQMRQAILAAGFVPRDAIVTSPGAPGSEPRPPTRTQPSR